MHSFNARSAVLAALAALLLVPCASPQGQVQQDAETRFNAGLGHLRDGRPQMAEEEFKRAIKEDGKNPYSYKGLGLAYAAQKKFADAVGAFRKALEINPYYVDVRNDLGSALVLSGRRSEGKAEFLAAFNDPTNPTPEISARNLGQALLEEKNYAESANWFRSSVNRNKAYPDAYLGIGDALLALGRVEDAVAILETGAKECTGSSALQVALGEAYFRAGRHADARARLEEARRQDPVGPDGRRAAELLKNLPR